MKPYWSNGRATLWQGHVLDALAAMEAGSAHCCVTSPPYWGLRDYNLPPVEWPPVSYVPMAGLPPLDIPGCDPGCGHVWGEEQVKISSGGPCVLPDAGKAMSESRYFEASQGQYCQLCHGWRGCLGLEPTPAMFVGHIVLVARALWRVLRDDGTFWLNFGDSYQTTSGGGQQVAQTNTGAGLACKRAPASVTGLKPKDLIGIPWRVAFALQADGWYLRSDIIWAKGVSFCPTYSGSCMPESVRDRPTKGHEYVFLLSKNKRYFYDGDAVREGAAKPPGSNGNFGNKNADARMVDKLTGNMTPGVEYKTGTHRNLRSVWTINPGSYTKWGETSRLVRVALDDVSDGTMHITSPSCPVHGCQDRPDDEHASDSESRTVHSSLDRAQLQHFAPASNSKHPASHSPDCSLDSQALVCSRVATDHSTQNHKTGRAPETSLSCRLCAKKSCRIADKSTSLVCAVLYENMPDCNTWPDEMDARLLDQIPYHTVGKSSLSIPPDCLCGFYHKITKKSSHFATFPPKLVEPMIKAGTSQRGCCPKCLSPWVRVTEPTAAYKEKLGKGQIYRYAKDGPSGPGIKVGTESNRSVTSEYTTTGWTPTCTCGTEHPISQEELDADPTLLDDFEIEPLEPVPCTVLDLFLGSGTTADVAIRLGRHAVGIELSKPYCDDHIIPRLSEPLFEWAEQERAEQEQCEPEPEIEQMGLL